MNIEELLATLKDTQVSLMVDGEYLVAKANKGFVTKEIRNSLTKYKQESNAAPLLVSPISTKYALNPKEQTPIKPPTFQIQK